MVVLGQRDQGTEQQAQHEHRHAGGAPWQVGAVAQQQPPGRAQAEVLPTCDRRGNGGRHEGRDDRAHQQARGCPPHDVRDPLAFVGQAFAAVEQARIEALRPAVDLDRVLRETADRQGRGIRHFQPVHLAGQQQVEERLGARRIRLHLGRPAALHRAQRAPEMKAVDDRDREEQAQHHRRTDRGRIAQHLQPGGPQWPAATDPPGVEQRQHQARDHDHVRPEDDDLGHQARRTRGSTRV